MRRSTLILLLLLSVVWSSAQLPPATAACKPAVLATASVVESPGPEVTAIRVDLRASADVPGGDLLARVSFGNARNARVEADGLTRQVPSTVTLSRPAATWSFLVRKVTRGSPFAVDYVVTDACGQVPKFAGAGMGAAPALATSPTVAPTTLARSPTPTATATATATPRATRTPTATPRATRTPTPAAMPAVEATIANFVYLPDPIVIPVGGTVRWTNLDIADHTVTSEEKGADGISPAWTSPVLFQNDTYTRTFGQPGRYVYFCEPHPQMVAEVVVQ